jgi:hypothetical protein
MSFVVKAVKSVAKAVGNVITGVVKAVGKVISSVVNFVASPFMGIFGSPDIPNDSAEADRQQGVLIQQTGSNVNIPVVYGYRKLAGSVTFAETGADNNRYLWVVYTFAEGAVEGLREIFIDDTQLDNNIIAPLNAGQAIELTTGKYAGRVRLQFFQGTFYSNPANSPIGTQAITKDSPSWKSTMAHNGLVTMFARYEWKEIKTQEDSDNNPFSGGIPQVQVCLLGKKVASLIDTDTENYSYGSANYTERYSTNPAEILLDYLRNPRYGKGLSNSEIDWASFRTAAAKCNQTVTYVNGIQGPIMTTNIVLDTGQTLFNNTKTLLSNFRGYLPFVQGKYKLKIEDAGNANDILSGAATIVKTFTKDNMVGSITYTGIDRGSKYNQVVVRYVDPDLKWSVQEVVYPEQEALRLSLQIDDGGRENKAEITFPGLTNYAIAKDMARLILEKSRYQDSITFKGDSSCFELEPGDNVYIEANILKFGTDPNANAIPWRIVSIKLNNDYTFDIGAVRNPDFMYPHARVGEIDVVLPPYIPKGAEIYYPGNRRTPPVGLVPPTSADFPRDGAGDPIIADPVVNPPPTDGTDATGGGGVGAPDGPVNEGGGVNTPPPAPTPIQELTDFITIDNYVVSGNATTGFFLFLTYKQPNNALFDSVDFYYKRSIASETRWDTVNVPYKPGAGQDITATLKPLIAGFTYIIKSRVKYSTGESSKFAGTVNIPIVAGGTGNPVDYQETVTSGWLVNTEAPPLTYNNVFKSIDGRPIAASNPRRANITVVQDINNYPITNKIAGVDIYFKPSANTYWTKQPVDFVAYSEGAPYTFEFPATLGTAGTTDKYDWVVRFRYTDGKQSTKQYRVMNTDVQTDALGATNFNIFTTTQAIAQGQEDVTAFNLLTTEDAPPGGGVADPREFKFTVTQSKNLATGNSSIGFHIDPVVDPDTIWRGARLYFKEAGAATWSSTRVSPMNLSGGFYFIGTVIKYNVQYEYFLVPLVSYNGAVVNAFKGWYGKGAVNFVAGTTFPNYWQQLNFILRDSSVVLQEAQAGGPKTQVQVVEWSRIQRDGTGSSPSTLYFQVKYNAENISNFTRVEIYRRERSITAQDRYNNYYGVGRWEKLTISGSNSTTASGVTTVNLRVPLSHAEFNYYYGAPSADSVNNSTVVSIQPDYTTNKPLCGFRAERFEYMIVTVTSTGNSLQLLPHIPYIALTSKVNGFTYGLPTNVTESSYNAFPVLYLRNFNQSVASIATANLRFGTNSVASLSPVPAGEPAVV